MADAGIRPGDRVVEVGAGFGSLTVALAAAGAEVLAVEFDRSLLPALEEVVGQVPSVRIESGDAMRMDWIRILPGRGWKMVSNLPYNIAVPLVAELLEGVSAISSFLVMVQREVGERLAAGPGEAAYGAVSVRVAYRAEAELVRRVPASVFWPRPKVDSVLVRMSRRAEPPVSADPARLFQVVEAGFAERRKTVRNALRRLGLPASDADAALARCGIPSNARAEELSLEDFSNLAEAV